jgi:hypothetical protein
MLNKQNVIVTVYKITRMWVQVEVRADNETYAGGALLAIVRDVPAEDIGKVFSFYEKDVRFSSFTVRPLPDGLNVR